MASLYTKFQPVNNQGTSSKKTTQSNTGGKGLYAKFPQSQPIEETKSKQLDVNSVEGLLARADEIGLSKTVRKQLERDIGKKDKLSVLQRLGTGLGAFNPAEAILTGVEEDSVLEGAKKYVKGVGIDLAEMVTGRDIDKTKRRTFSDVAEELGVENKILKGGIGFVGDVLLDPTTYFGGAMIRGLTKGTKLAVGATAKGVKAGSMAINPKLGSAVNKVGEAIDLTQQGLKDAFGTAFNYGYKATEGAREQVLTLLSRTKAAQLSLAGSNLNRLGVGTLTKAQQKELALNIASKKIAEFELGEAIAKNTFDENAIMQARSTASKLIQEAIDTKNFSKIDDISPELSKKLQIIPESKVVRETIKKLYSRTQKFAEQADVANPYVNYYPFLKKDKIEGFIKQASASGLKVGSEGYKKQFKNLLTLDNIELDPAKAFFTREAQIVTDNMNRKFLDDFVKNMGKPLNEFKNADEATAAGFKVLKEKGMFGKELGYVKDWDYKLLRDSLGSDFQTVSMLAKATGFDALTNLFKRSVTGLFVPFHVRNYVSGMIQNYEKLGVSALNPKTIASGQRFATLLAKNSDDVGKGVMKIGTKDVPVKEVFKAFKDRFGGDTFYSNDFIWALDHGGTLKQALPTFSKQRVGETIKTMGLGQEGIPFKLGRVVGQFVEHQQKATAYLAALSNGDDIGKALKAAESAGFDYGALTKFESQIMRRIIPFYSFTRKNIQLQLETLGYSPQRINHIIALIRNIGEVSGDEISEEEKKWLPDYIKDSLAIKLQDSPDGLKRYISSFGTPLEAFTQLLGANPVLRGISIMNPIIKTPTELGIGKDTFRNEDIKDVYNAKEYKTMPKILKDILEIKEVEKPVLEKQKDGTLKQVGTKIQYVADPYKLTIARSLFTSRGVTYLDSVFGGDLNGFAKYLNATTGVKVREVDLAAQEAFKDKASRESIIDTLVRYEGAEQFKKAYIPKDGATPNYGEDNIWGDEEPY